MFRIGFDPILETEYRREELIREIQRIRMAETVIEAKKLKTHPRNKLLALVGRRMASFGSILEARYGDQLESTAGLHQRDVSSGCA